MDGRQWDVAILGGGIIGLGTARALTRAGYSVLLVERGLIGQGTSSQSHRIMHSGFRYLQTLGLRSLIDSAYSLQTLLEEFPSSVLPLDCCMPLFSSYGVKSRAGMRMAQISYEAIVGIVGLRRPRWRGTEAVSLGRHRQLLELLNCKSVFYWQDGLLSDHGSIVATLGRQVTDAGSLIREHATVGEIRSLGTSAGYELHVNEHAAIERIRALAVVDARGAGIDDHIKGAPKFPRNSWCVGFNVRLRAPLGMADGVALPQQHNKRFLFLAPRDAETVALGTGYRQLLGTDLEVSEAEQEAFVGLLSPEVVKFLGPLEPHLVERGVLPRAEVQSEEVLPDAKTVVRQSGNYLQIRAGKYTTFPVVANRLTRMIGALIGPRVKGAVGRASSSILHQGTM